MGSDMLDDVKCLFENLDKFLCIGEPDTDRPSEVMEHWAELGFVERVSVDGVSFKHGYYLNDRGRALLQALRDKQMMDVLRKNVVGSGDDYDGGMWVKFPCMISELNDGYWILDAVAKCLHGKEQKKHDEAR